MAIRETTKQCRKCKKEKNLEEFQKYRYGNRKQSVCIECFAKGFYNKKSTGKRSEETKKKISAALTGLEFSEERLKNIQIATAIAMNTDKVKQKVSKGLIRKHKEDKEFYEANKNRLTKYRKANWNDESYNRKMLEVNKKFKTSNTKPEIKMKEILDELGIDYIHQFWTSEAEKPSLVDFYLPDFNLIIEVDGVYWHNFPKGNLKDHEKTAMFKKAGYRVLRVWQNHFTKQSIEIELANVDKLKIYQIGGWFDEYQVKALDYIEEVLYTNENFIVYSPRKEIILHKDNQNMKKEVFEENLYRIQWADIVVASTVGKDTGSLFECGYSHSLKKPIVYTLFDERLGDKVVFNLMLGVSGIATFTDKKEFKEFMSTITKDNFLEAKKIQEGNLE